MEGLEEWKPKPTRPPLHMEREREEDRRRREQEERKEREREQKRQEDIRRETEIRKPLNEEKGWGPRPPRKN